MAQQVSVAQVFPAVMGMMEVIPSPGCHPSVPFPIQCLKEVVLNQPQTILV